MHKEAERFVQDCGALVLPERGLDVGGRDVNGSCRRYFLGCSWRVLDIEDGEGVDIVADFATWETDERFDLVLCTEVLEHALYWPDLVRAAADVLVPGGHLVLTAATYPRSPHSAIDGGPLRDLEPYENVDAQELWQELVDLGLYVERFAVERIAPRGAKSGWGDVYVMARKC